MLAGPARPRIDQRVDGLPAAEIEVADAKVGTLGDREGVAQRRQQRLSDVIEDSGHRGVNIDVMFGPLSDGWPCVGSERCLIKRERVYTRSTTGTAKSPHRSAINTPPVGGVHRASPVCRN